MKLSEEISRLQLSAEDHEARLLQKAARVILRLESIANDDLSSAQMTPELRIILEYQQQTARQILQ